MQRTAERSLRLCRGAQWVQLGRSIGRGGEGEVFESTSGKDRALKLYFDPDRAPTDKLTYLVEHPPTPSSSGTRRLAWPEDLVEESGRIQGFEMAIVPGGRPLFEVFNPVLRSEGSLQFDGRALVGIARDLAELVASVHGNPDLCIGDLNESNVLLDAEGRPWLIDVDSFQVRQGERVHCCGVGKGPYLAPELQGRDLRSTTRGPSEDNFSLAVLVFQLLMEGAHPFEAQSDDLSRRTSLEERIRALEYPHGITSESLRPPKLGLDIRSVGKEIETMFVQAFQHGGRYPELRPTARTWQGALERHLATLRTCPEDSAHAHRPELSECPHCQRRKRIAVEPPPPVPKPKPRPAATTFPGGASFPGTTSTLGTQRTYSAATRTSTSGTTPRPTRPSRIPQRSAIPKTPEAAWPWPLRLAMGSAVGAWSVPVYHGLTAAAQTVEERESPYGLRAEELTPPAILPSAIGALVLAAALVAQGFLTRGVPRAKAQEAMVSPWAGSWFGPGPAIGCVLGGAAAAAIVTPLVSHLAGPIVRWPVLGVLSIFGRESLPTHSLEVVVVAVPWTVLTLLSLAASAAWGVGPALLAALGATAIGLWQLPLFGTVFFLGAILLGVATGDPLRRQWSRR